jgi:hypothetical protein
MNILLVELNKGTNPEISTYQSWFFSDYWIKSDVAFTISIILAFKICPKNEIQNYTFNERGIMHW